MASVVTEVEGVRIEESAGGLASLTIDLQVAVPAGSLAVLLQGLADLYRLGASMDTSGEDPWISWGERTSRQFASSSELFISRLEIGTPNKVTVTGRSALIRDLYALVVTIGLAKAIFFPTHAPTPAPPPEPPAISMTATEYMQAVNENLMMRRTLDEQLQEGSINIGEYMHRRSIIENALKDVQQGMQIARTRPANS
ncbi:MAG: hypothetical protein SXG53_03170 [Pseudomonadota bacterium]|nr:hypothetical protein [Pseudomonadota bacterium]